MKVSLWSPIIFLSVCVSVRMFVLHESRLWGNIFLGLTDSMAQNVSAESRQRRGVRED